VLLHAQVTPGPGITLYSSIAEPFPFSERPEVSDQDSFERLRKGDEGGFDDIFRAHYAGLVGFAYSILKDRADAEDTAQEVMLELWRRRSNIVLETSLRAYLFQSTRNRALNRIRHQRVVDRAEPEITPPAAAPRPDRALTEREMAVVVQQALADLPDRCREVFRLSREQGLRYAEIAAALGISVKTVEAQIGKALRLLRARLAPWLPGSSG
jgi:RNA polymerase sigma-70 factor (ECF subfamily)